MKICFNVEEIKFEKHIDFEPDEGYFWLDKVIALIRDTGLLSFNYYKHTKGKYVNIKNNPEGVYLYKAVYEQEDGDHVYFAFYEDENKEGNEVTFFLCPSYMGFRMRLSDSSDSIVNQLTELFFAINDVLSFKKTIGPAAYIGPCEYSFPRRRKIKNFDFLQSACFVNFIDKNYYEREPFRKFQGLESLFSSELPHGAIRTNKETIYTIKWIDSIEDEKAVKEAMMAREDWANDNLSLSADHNFNYHGDKQLSFQGGAAFISILAGDVSIDYGKKDQTLYIKAFDDAEDITISNELCNMIEHYAPIKEVTGGDLCNKVEVVKNIILIVKERKKALAVKKQALELGCQKVFYSDYYGVIWDIDPDIIWRDE